MPDIIKDILTKEEVERIMDKIKKLQDDSLFMSELEAMEWQEWEDRSIQTEMRKKGFDDGLALGIKEGIKENTRETILAMINNNLSLETISKITNKTIEEINEIINID